MNCQDFDAVILELVRGEAASSAMTEGRAHAASCARCAALFSEQQSLSLELAALAARAQETHAPQRIEWVLRAEFRRQHTQAPKPGIHQWRGETDLSLIRIFGNRKAWALAAILIGVAGGVIAMKFLMKPKVMRMTQTQPQQTVQPRAPRPPTVAAADPESLNGHQATRSAARRRGSHQRARAQASPAPAQGQNSSDEWATNFYPLPYGSGLDLDEGWEIVRVNVPVSALASLGVPATNTESSVQYVKADVVLGGDGMARAIRFIR
jgi:hypothetical protein